MIRTALTCSLLAGLLLAGGTHAAELTVNVHDVRAQTGTLRAALVSSDEAWNGKAAPVQAQQAHPHGDSLHFTFKDLPAGSYAVLLTHVQTYNAQVSAARLKEVARHMGVDVSAMSDVQGAEAAIRWWTARGEDPTQKLVIFSDGLDVDQIMALHRQAARAPRRAKTLPAQTCTRVAS